MPHVPHLDLDIEELLETCDFHVTDLSCLDDEDWTPARIRDLVTVIALLKGIMSLTHDDVDDEELEPISDRGAGEG